MNPRELSLLLSGGIICGNLIVALYFVRFWRQTRDRLFVYFALSFAVLALERAVIVEGPANASERSPLVYLFRLFAFLLIIWAILEKNRRKPGPAV